MAVEFIVEDGSGKTGATSYCTVNYFVQYWENRGTDYSELTDAVVQSHLNAATEYIDNDYIFTGKRSHTTQALEFPRVNVPQRVFGLIYDSDSIPVDLRKAVAYLAAQILDSPAIGVDDGVRQRRYGSVSLGYVRAPGDRGFPQVEKYLSYMLNSANMLQRAN